MRLHNCRHARLTAPSDHQLRALSCHTVNQPAHWSHCVSQSRNAAHTGSVSTPATAGISWVARPAAATHPLTVKATATSASPTGSPMDGGSSTAPMDIVGFTGTTAPAGHEASLPLLMSALQCAVKQIAGKVARAGLEGLTGLAAQQQGAGSGDVQKKLDVVADELMTGVLLRCPVVAVVASEEQDAPSSSRAPGGRYAVVFDPLDGSRNIDAAIPTGTIWGVYSVAPGQDPAQAVLQPGSNLVAAGYALYSSATMMVVSSGQGVHGFTLDPLCGEFLLSHHNIRIPARGQIYSVNDARYHDWPAGLQRYIDDIRQGRGAHPKQYSARYICSLVADFHRTLLYGGVAMNPRAHLRLVYEGNPLALLAEQAGGAASDGVRPIRGIPPERLHQRLPLFLGSPEDITELESYGDVQQLGTKTYEV